MKIHIGKAIFQIFVVGKRTQTDNTDYCISEYIDLLLALAWKRVDCDCTEKLFELVAFITRIENADNLL